MLCALKLYKRNCLPVLAFHHLDYIGHKSFFLCVLFIFTILPFLVKQCDFSLYAHCCLCLATAWHIANYLWLSINSSAKLIDFTNCERKLVFAFKFLKYFVVRTKIFIWICFETLTIQYSICSIVIFTTNRMWRICYKDLTMKTPKNYYICF